jgi:hypothetical protein
VNDSPVYFVLYPYVTRDDFERAATDLGFVKHHTTPGGEREPYEQVWAGPDRTTALNYLESPLMGLHYVILRSHDLPTFSLAWARRLHIFNHQEALELARGATDHNRQVEALARLAVMFPQWDPQVFSVFEAYATQHPSPLLRAAAVNYMVFSCWPEFLPLLERIATQDAADNVRRRAQEIMPYVRATSSPATPPKGRSAKEVLSLAQAAHAAFLTGDAQTLELLTSLTSAGVRFDDIRSAKDLVERLGAQKLRQLADVLSVPVAAATPS